MKIQVSTKPVSWSDFEDREWKVADLEHYGRIFEWKARPFKITVLDNEEIVGSLAMDIVVGIVTIQNIIVTKELRGKGIGKMLMGKAEDVGKEEGAHKIQLQTGKTWDTVPFYELLGFKITGTLPNHYNHVDFVEMTKFI